MEASAHGLFNLDPLTGRLAPPLRSAVEPALSSLLALRALNATYDRVKASGAADFCKAALDCLNIEIEVAEAELARIPTEGPLIVVANHPFGGIEGLILGHLLRTVRPDVRLLANALLGQIPDMAPLCIFVDAMQTRQARRTNIRGLHEAIDWTRNGGCLAVFPGGEVSSWNLKTRRVTDPPWKSHTAALIRRTGASVVPIHFSGRNRALFQVAGLINSHLRTVLLPRELLHKQGRHIGLRVGTPIENRPLLHFSTSEALMTYLRGRTYALTRDRPRASLVRKLPLPGRRRQPGATAPVAPDAVDPDILEAELADLPADHKLAANGDLVVYRAEPAAIPRLMEALGRLREVTFRAVGEGTGQSLDLDHFDYRYQHLLIWDAAQRRLVGGYRLGPTDLLAAGDEQPLYVQTLFKLRPAFLDAVQPGIELGRSFVRQEYQRGFGPLMLLWRAIGRFIAQQPRYRHLFGPVTISADYSPASQTLIVASLSRPGFRSPLAETVEPRRPFKSRHSARPELARLSAMVDSADHLDALVRDIEGDGKGLPILLKQYLRLGARCVAFNRDPDFGDCLDCLCLFDVLEIDRRTMHKYMGRESSDTYLAAHRGRVESGI